MKQKTRAPKSSLAKRQLQKFLNNKLAVIGLCVLLLIILLCVLAPVITSYDPAGVNPKEKLQGVSAEHPLGTDQLGRDILARILYGGRLSILIGLASAILSGILGIALGCISGYFGGKVDAILYFVGEIFACFPQMILIMVIMSFLGKSVGWLIFVFVITGWVGGMRMARSKILSLKQEPFVDTCRVMGVNGWVIMFKHLLPNIVGIVTVNITTHVAGFVLSEAGLSFLGMGVSPSVPTWGNMINAAKSLNVMVNEPMLWIVPGVVISLFVLSCNFFGDGLRDALDVTQ